MPGYDYAPTVAMEAPMREMTIEEHGKAVADAALELAAASERLVDTQQRHAMELGEASHRYDAARSRFSEANAGFEHARNQRNLK